VKRPPVVARPVAAFFAVATLHSAALAHGVPPAVLDVAAVEAGGQPRVVTMTEGLAQRRGDSWRYVCPVQFGNEPSPPAMSVDGEHTTVVGEKDLFILGPDGSVTARGLADLSRSAVIRIAATRDSLYVLRFSAGTSSVARIDESGYTLIWSDASLHQSLDAGSDHLWVAGTRAGRTVLRKLSERGDVLDERHFDVELGGWVSHVVNVGAHVYATLIASHGARLIRLGPYDAGSEVALEASSTIFGAVVTGTSSTWAAANGVLYSIVPGEALAMPAAGLATGLSGTGTHSFLLSSLRVFALGATGVGSVVADLKELKQPALELVDPDLREACSAQWAVFEGDLRPVTRSESDAGRSAATDSENPAIEAGEPGAGCAVRSPADDWAGSAAASCALLVVCAATIRSQLSSRSRSRCRCRPSSAP